jgi:CheY-like chemotaxis protein
MMPGMSGPELCRCLGADPGLRTIPIVLMSAAPERADLSGCRYAALVHKPFPIEQLLTVVSTALADRPQSGR